MAKVKRKAKERRKLWYRVRFRYAKRRCAEFGPWARWRKTFRGALYSDHLGHLPKTLTRDLMRLDASEHPGGEQPFNEWAWKYGPCPYMNENKAKRVAWFYEDRHAWKPGPPPPDTVLIKRLQLAQVLEVRWGTTSRPPKAQRK